MDKPSWFENVACTLYLIFISVAAVLFVYWFCREYGGMAI